MSQEPTDAASPAPTRRSMQTRPVALPPTSTDGVVASVPTDVSPAAQDAPTERVATADAIGVGFETDTNAAAGTLASPDTEPELAWAPPAQRRPPALGGWALSVAIIGLMVSLVVGWGFPVGIIAVITAIAALRRPGQRRQAAGWALGLGILSLLYSALWIAVAVSSGPLF